MKANGDKKTVLLVTARHVLFTSERKRRNKAYKSKGDSRHNVLLFSRDSYAHYLESIEAEIISNAISVEIREQEIRDIVGEGGPLANEKYQQLQVKLDKARTTTIQLEGFYRFIHKRWAKPRSHILGQVILSPPSASASGMTATQNTGR